MAFKCVEMEESSSKFYGESSLQLILLSFTKMFGVFWMQSCKLSATGKNYTFTSTNDCNMELSTRRQIIRKTSCRVDTARKFE